MPRGYSNNPVSPMERRRVKDKLILQNLDLVKKVFLYEDTTFDAKNTEHQEIIKIFREALYSNKTVPCDIFTSIKKYVKILHEENSVILNTHTNWLENWEPQDSICIEFDDKNREVRSQLEMNIMVNRLRSIANEYGFDLHMIGMPENMYKALQLRYKNE